MYDRTSVQSDITARRGNFHSPLVLAINCEIGAHRVNVEEQFPSHLSLPVGVDYPIEPS